MTSSPASPAAIPTGTVTFLFTDIEGSTRLWEQHPDEMRIALVRHDTILRQSIETQGGFVFKTVGDAFCAAFPTAPDALAASLLAQLSLLRESWPEATPIRVRMALHTGIAQERDADYFGPVLNRVARLLATGHGGQTLVSAATYELVRDHLPGQSGLKDLGAHRLKDLERPEQVYQVTHSDLPDTFPSLKSLDNVPNNLPQQLTSFIGREHEMAELRDLLTRVRLLTLTGSGGCGKTRLALQVAADLLEQYPDGVWLVELAPLTDPLLVPQTVASVLGIREERERTLTETVIAGLKPKRLLLVMDNCEHLLTACAYFAEAVLRGCPHISIIASSRSPLGIGGEQTYRVPSLSLPTTPQRETVASLSQDEAVRLFIDRALSVQPHFHVTNASAPALAQLCLRLDGIPLALELAAARLRSLSLEEINARLDNRFRLLTGGSRTALPRQQTLRSLIDWSYDLLDEREKMLLRRLSVFAGGWTLVAAEHVCGHSDSGGINSDGSDELEAWEVLDLLVSLVDKSLVTTELPEAPPPASSAEPQDTRYRLLETVRQYAWERLEESGESPIVREWHQTYFADFAEGASGHLRGADESLWLNRLEAEHDNLRAALERQDTNPTNAEEPAEAAADQALRIAAALSRFWYVRGYFQEGRERLEQALAETSARHKIRAKALSGAASLAFAQGDYEAARTAFEESRTLYQELGDRSSAATQVGNLGIIASTTGDYARAQALQEESLALSRELGNAVGIASALHNLGSIAAFRGDLPEARRRYEESLVHYRALGHQGGIANALGNLGGITCDSGDYEAARRYLDEALRLRRALGDPRGTAYALESYAVLAVAEGQFERAVRLWGAANALRESLHVPLPTHDAEKRRRHMEQARTAMGSEAFDAVWTAAATLSLDQAIELALQALTGPD